MHNKNFKLQLALHLMYLHNKVSFEKYVNTSTPIIWVFQKILDNNITLKTNQIIFVVVVQLAQLALERLSFGNMPLFSKARRIIFVINRSKTCPLFFKWHVTSQADSQVSFFENESKMLLINYACIHIILLYLIDVLEF